MGHTLIDQLKLQIAEAKFHLSQQVITITVSGHNTAEFDDMCTMDRVHGADNIIRHMRIFPRGTLFRILRAD